LLKDVALKGILMGNNKINHLMDKPPRYDHNMDKYKLSSILPNIQRNTHEISKTKDEREEK